MYFPVCVCVCVCVCVYVTYGILQQMSEFAVPVGDVWSLLCQSSQDVGQR